MAVRALLYTREGQFQLSNPQFRFPWPPLRSLSQLFQMADERFYFRPMEVNPFRRCCRARLGPPPKLPHRPVKDEVLGGNARVVYEAADTVEGLGGERIQGRGSPVLTNQHEYPVLQERAHHDTTDPSEKFWHVCSPDVSKPSKPSTKRYPNARRAARPSPEVDQSALER